MFLSTLIIVTLTIVSLIEYESKPSDPMLKPERLRQKYQKKKNVTIIEGADGYLGCLDERNDYNPRDIEWNYGKDLESLKRINSKEIIYDYPLDKVYKDQAIIN